MDLALLLQTEIARLKANHVEMESRKEMIEDTEIQLETAKNT
jgi:hypothetical protein